MTDSDGASCFAASLQPPVLSVNRTGTSRFVILCDHASNRMPDPYGTLGLSARERLMHVAWDPGALGVSKMLAEILDAPLVHSTVSRLVIDPNRAHDAPGLIPAQSEHVIIPANENIGTAERTRRIKAFHTPYHQAISDLLDERESRGIESVVVAMHSFTPVYNDVPRPWPVGVIHGGDEAFTRALHDVLEDDAPDMNVGWNEPYVATQGIYYTVGTHADQRGLHGTMVEIRNDEILEQPGVTRWAHRMALCLEEAIATLVPVPVGVTKNTEAEISGNL